MRYIALEEAFSIPDLADREPPAWAAAGRFNPGVVAEWARKLPDFTEYRLPEMDAASIDVQVLSLTVPGLQADIDAAAARDDARLANDYLARVVADHPDRFRGFAALPMQDPKAAATELDRCVRELGFCGALVNDHLQGHYLDEPRYDEVWAALEELSVPLYLHPGAPPAGHWKVLDGRPELYGATWSWAAETGGHALRIIYGGVFDRHPGATLILGHMGEFLPFMRSRLDSRYLTLDPEAPPFMDNIAGQAGTIKNQGMFFSPIDGDRKLPTVATRDIAAAASRLLLDDGWSGVGVVPLLGPEDLSFNDMAEIISAVLDKEVRFQQITFEAYKDRFVGFGMSDAMAQGMTDMAWAKNEGLDNAVQRTPENSTPTSFRVWCEEVLKAAVLD